MDFGLFKKVLSVKHGYKGSNKMDLRQRFGNNLKEKSMSAQIIIMLFFIWSMVKYCTTLNRRLGIFRFILNNIP